MKKDANIIKIDSYPEFDDSILSASQDEVVRAVQTIPLNEFRLLDFCKEKEIVSYLPLRKKIKIQNIVRGNKSYNYSREVLRPMFPNYVFVKSRPEFLRELFESKVMVRFLQPNNQEAFLDDIRTVRKAELVGLEEELEIHRDIPEGAHFLIQSGVWQGVTGWLSKKNNMYKWTVRIEFAEQMISATIDPTKFRMVRLDD